MAGACEHHENLVRTRPGQQRNVTFVSHIGNHVEPNLSNTKCMDDILGFEKWDSNLIPSMSNVG
jgi:hypothetical protein